MVSPQQSAEPRREPLFKTFILHEPPTAAGVIPPRGVIETRLAIGTSSIADSSSYG